MLGGCFDLSGECEPSAKLTKQVLKQWSDDQRRQMNGCQLGQPGRFVVD
ncbi:MAG: hypothetical protein ACI89J_002068 [Hyphomicrobiaceae bacterium]|jgi:hypothetical protein